MGFEALFLRNAVQMLQAQAGLATPLSPLVNSFPSSYMPPAPPSPATSVSMPRRRNSFSQSSSLSMSDPTRSNNPQPASFFLTNPYQTGPSEMQRPMSSMTPPSAGRRAHFADEPSSFRQGAASLFAAGPSNEDILKAARPPPGPSPHPGHSRNTSSLPTPPHTPQRRSSGSETVLEWEDVRTGRQVTWKPFEGWKFWQEPAWLTRADGVDREELSVGKRAIVVSGWRAATGPLAKAITGQAVPPSALQRLHVEVGSPIVVLGLFKMRDEIYVAAYSRRRVAENGLCAYGLLPLSTVSVTGRKPETHPLVYDTSLHESAFGFEAWVRSTNGLAPVEGVITGEPRPALLMQRTDDESSALPGPLGAVMRVDLQRVTVAKKRPEVRELLDSFGARQRQTLWVFEVRTQENLGSQTKELLFKREPWIDEIIFAARRVCPTVCQFLFLLDRHD